MNFNISEVLNFRTIHSLQQTLIEKFLLEMFGSQSVQNKSKNKLISPKRKQLPYARLEPPNL